MIVVTGAAGFIGSNLMQGLNARGHTNILAVDDLTEGKKFVNLAAARFSDYMHYEDFLIKFTTDKTFRSSITAVMHQGACSTTTEWDGRYMMAVNYEFSKALFHACIEDEIPFIYASSAAVYGMKKECVESDWDLMPLNVYGYSKLLFDQYYQDHLDTVHSQVAGLRYFNVYGPGEQHKGSMASVAFHFMNQLADTGTVKLFEGCDGYADGEQQRDFVFVDDVVAVNCWLLDNPLVSGIFNVGTGEAQSFNALARHLLTVHGSGEVTYVPFPAHLKGYYQSFTEADISALKAAGYPGAQTTLQTGIEKYYQSRFLSSAR